MDNIKPPKSNQFRAMFFKNATFIKRQKCSMCVQISIPMVLVIVLIIVNLWIKSQISKNQDSSSINIVSSYESYSFQDSYQGYIYLVNKQDFENSQLVGSRGPAGNGSGLLGDIYQIQGQWSFSNFNGSSPYFVETNSADSMNDMIVSIKQNITKNDAPIFLYTFPISGLMVNSFSPDDKSVDFTVTCETQSRYTYTSNAQDCLAFTLNEMATAFINYLLDGKNVTVQSAISNFPYYSTEATIDVASLLGGSFYPFSLSFIMPLFIYQIVYEKQEKLRDLSLMMGLKIRNYWLMTYIFNLLIYAIIIVFVVGLSSIFQFAVFVKGSQFAMFLFLFGWGNALITFSFFLSTFFKKTRAASIFGYFFVILVVNLNSILSVVVFNKSAPPVPYYWVPLLAFYRGMSVLSTSCGLDLCPNWTDYTWDFEISKIIFWLYIDAIVYLILALYLDKVLPREFGIPNHPLFFLHEFKKLFKKENNDFITTGSSTNDKHQKYNETSVLLNSDIISEEQLDSDVQAEKDMIINNRYNPRDMTVIIEGLSKTYPGRPKPALDNLYLTIRKGQVLGLLGPNGAGKTTTISMLTGLYTPSSGTATISGLDIRNQMDSIHCVIGVSMQFDIFWEDLSCVETLLYYSRLKGIPKERELQSVESVLKEVNLFEVKERLVKELSGGMKRRLSFAVAMTGDSSIIFLDEPTTGLDPSVKRELWQTINELKRNRSIVLTTHSMEEADVLSDVIAIVSQGKLQCLGTQSHLKKKFGDGYSIRINIEKSFINTHNPTDLIKEFSPQAILSEFFNGSYMYRLPKDTTISDLYEYLVLNKDKHHLQEWSFSQTSLEDVFLKISAGDETVN